ncbi:MAG: hypothetical protein IPL50_07845 [Chitinophagaceae bacterium]|nr:hypothetical protein [Chitinophagaceae bacterium]
MAINKNHEFEELDGVKCGIVEKNVSPERVAFLKKLLEFNKFTVVVVPSPPPKVAPAPVVKVAEDEVAPPPPLPPPAPLHSPQVLQIIHSIPSMPFMAVYLKLPMGT